MNDNRAARGRPRVPRHEWDRTRAWLRDVVAAKHCGIPHGTFIAMSRRGEIPFVVSPHGVPMYDRDELDRWLDERKHMTVHGWKRRRSGRA